MTLLKLEKMCDPCAGMDRLSWFYVKSLCTAEVSTEELLICLWSDRRCNGGNVRDAGSKSTKLLKEWKLASLHPDK